MPVKDERYPVDSWGMLMTGEIVINVTDQRVEDDRRLRDWLLAACHVDDPNPCDPEGDNQ